MTYVIKMQYAIISHCVLQIKHILQVLDVIEVGVSSRQKNKNVIERVVHIDIAKNDTYDCRE